MSKKPVAFAGTIPAFFAQTSSAKLVGSSTASNTDAIEHFPPRINLLKNSKLKTSVNHWYGVPKNVLQGADKLKFDNDLKLARQHLTVIPKDVCGFGPKKTVGKKRKRDAKDDDEEDVEGPRKLYKENNDYFYVPRFYGATKWGNQHVDTTVTGTKISVTFAGSLLSKQSRHPIPQQESVNTVVSTLLDQNKTNGVLVSLPCGFGKTVVAMAIAATLGVRTLFLCHTGNLMEQAIERCKQFLPDARIGILRKDKCEIEDKDIIFGTLQSLYKRDYPQHLLDTIGLTIVDECHHASSQTFATAILKLRSRYILGLSATPKRKDGLAHIFHWLLGPLLIKVDRTFEHVDCLFVEYTQGNQKEYTRGKNVNFDKMRKVVAGDATRNQLIISRIINKHFNSLSGVKRKAVAFSHLIDHLQLLKVGLGVQYKQLLESVLGGQYEIRHPSKNVEQIWRTDRNVESLEFSVGLYLGEMHLPDGKKYKLKKHDYALAEQCDVILATYQMMAEGVDIPRMDMAYFLTGNGDIEQPLGRVLRTHPDKNIPAMEYFFDPFSIHQGQGYKAMNYLKDLGYSIKWEKH